METTVRPGDVHVFRPGKAVAVGVGIWAECRSGAIHIHMTGPLSMHTTVTNAPKSARYHRTLFRDLRRILVANGAWPYGEQGIDLDEPQEA